MMSANGRFIVSTTDADDNRFEARNEYLDLALVKLVHDIDEGGGLSFTLERIDVRFEGPVATVRVPDEAFAADVPAIGPLVDPPTGQPILGKTAAERYLALGDEERDRYVREHGAIGKESA
jgi:hypothetical protein